MPNRVRPALLIVLLALVPVGLLLTAGQGAGASLRQSTLQPMEITASYIVAGATGTQAANLGTVMPTITPDAPATNAAATSIVRDATATGESIERGDFLTALRETQNAYYAPVTTGTSTVNAHIHNNTATALSPAHQTGTAIAPFTKVAATWEANQPLVTAYWQGATATAQAMPTFYLTASADVRTAAVLEQVRNMTLTAHPIDPLEATATYVVAGATITQAAYMTYTAVAKLSLPTPQPQLPSNLASVVAPLSPEEIENYRSEYTNELVSVTGFEHPIFDEIAANILENNAKSGRWELQHNIQVTQTKATGATFVALIVDVDTSWLWSDYLFLFRVTNDLPILLQNAISQVNGLSLGFGARIFDNWTEGIVGWTDKPIYIRGFYDWNRNGLPDLSISSDGGGNCCPPQLHVIEIKEDGTIVDISPPDVDVVPAAFFDPDHDGQWEIVGVNRRGGASPTYYRWFGWNGTTYVDTSPEHRDFYRPQIDAFKLRLEQNPECYNPQSYELENILYSYVAMGTLKEGWADIEPLLHWDICTAEQLKQFGSYMAYIEMWVKEHSS